MKMLRVLCDINIVCLLVALLLVGRGTADDSQTENRAQIEARLMANLVGDNSSYNKHALPAQNSSTPVDVFLSLILTFIEDLNEDTQALYTNGWFHLRWADVNLKWDQHEFGGIQSIRIPPGKLWTPDISVYNSHTFTLYGSSDEHIQISAIVRYNGDVTWFPHVRIVTPCPVDLTDFPFDTQRCRITFGSWTYDASKLNLHHTTSKLNEVYETTNTFKLVDSEVKLNIKKYSCCPESYQDIEYTVELKRQSTYTVHLVIVPTVVITIILPGIFLLPTGSTEKISFGMGLMVTEAVMLLVLTDMLPNSHPTVPRLGIYHIATMLMIAISLAICTFVSMIWNKGTRGQEMPIFLDKVVSVLGKVTFISRDATTAVGTYNQMELSNETGADDSAQMIPEKKCAGAEWRQLAAILDRVCFLLFFVACVVTAIVI